MKSIDEDLYSSEVGKYRNRLNLLRQRIPKLDCLWNDVIHCLPPHPTLVYKALVEGGLSPPERQWYMIDVESIIKNPWAWFAFSTVPPIPVPARDITILTADSYQELDTVPDATKEWYRYLAENHGKLHLTYRSIPHIFVKGNIDVSDATIIEWSDTRSE